MDYVILNVLAKFINFIQYCSCYITEIRGFVILLTRFSKHCKQVNEEKKR